MGTNYCPLKMYAFCHFNLAKPLNPLCLPFSHSFAEYSAQHVLLPIRDELEYRLRGKPAGGRRLGPTPPGSAWMLRIRRGERTMFLHKVMVIVAIIAMVAAAVGLIAVPISA